jgi:hypothetical protein
MVIAHATSSGYERVVIGSSAAGISCTVAAFTWLPDHVLDELALLGADIEVFDDDTDRILTSASSRRVGLDDEMAAKSCYVYLSGQKSKH